MYLILQEEALKYSFMLSLNLLYIAIILNHNVVSILLLRKLNSQKHDLSV